MMLRKRQRVFVNKCSSALQKSKNTLGVAPTGTGKTVMMAAIVSENAPKELPSLIVQHRDELVSQNRDTYIDYCGMNNIRRPMVIDADNKCFDRNPGGANFGMIQTLTNNLDSIPKIGFIGIDEAHHAVAPTYLSLLGRLQEMNPDLIVFGTTATPNRGDGKALKTVFSNCADNIPISEVIRDGHLVRPRTYVIDVGVNNELDAIKGSTEDDMEQIEKIMNNHAINDKIIEKWKDMAGDRQTIVFCPTVKHAEDFTKSMVDHGIKAKCIHGGQRIGTRRKILKDYDKFEFQVLVNVSITIEGFDNQPTSCVIMLRRESWKSTMTQMIGRGLRKVNPEKYPGIVKDDCIILDFGRSCVVHGSLEDEVNLYGNGVKTCPGCMSEVPQNSKHCPICAHEFPQPIVRVCPECEREHYDKSPHCACGYTFPVSASSSMPTSGQESTLGEVDFVMSEIDILQDSPFKYESFYDGRVMLCFGFRYWAAVLNYQDGRFYAIGAEQNSDNNYALHVLSSSDNYLMALQSADDYMRTKSTKTEAKRNVRLPVGQRCVIGLRKKSKSTRKHAGVAARITPGLSHTFMRAQFVNQNTVMMKK